MGIMFDAEKGIFHLQALNMSYVIKIVRNHYLAHVYWGKKLRQYRDANPLCFKDRSFSPNPDPEDRSISLDTLPQEYPGYGNSDFRNPAYQVQLENGSTITDLQYIHHKIFSGKPALAGLPAVYTEQDSEAQTLEILIEDKLTGLQVVTSYSVYRDLNVIVRSCRFINTGKQRLKILRALSATVDFRSASFEVLHLHGGWAKERKIARQELKAGTFLIESRRGASSHQHNPFLALVRKNTDEEQGEAFGFNLVYSGNFIAQAEQDQFDVTRVSIGINPFDFSWLLEPGESFQTPEVVMVYSDKGLGEMSRTYHRLYRTRLCRGTYRDKERPILINNWEATYYNFNAEKLLDIAKEANELGIELFVLDDGWFGKRNSDSGSLGDWVVDTNKLPLGLEDLVKRINGLELAFGLWFEPEMVSPDSDLYRKHPDWCLHVPERPCSEGRNQLILDLSRQEVCDYIIQSVSGILKQVPIRYVKWDMNRHMTEIGSAGRVPERQRETAHRYILGLYRILEEITSAFPDVLFESCSGGGGRFDPGMLYYMPQAWASDNNDAVCRLQIQYGTSMVYPISSIGAHVAAVPNHQVGRITSLKMRGDVAMSGNFGYELDLTQLSDLEKNEVAEQIKFYKKIRPLIQFGDFYRLRNPFECDEAAWMFVSAEQKEAIVFYFRSIAKPNASQGSICLKGLNPALNYLLTGSEAVWGGDELMYAGLAIPELPGDFQSHIWHLRQIGK